MIQHVLFRWDWNKTSRMIQNIINIYILGGISTKIYKTWKNLEKISKNNQTIINIIKTSSAVFKKKHQTIIKKSSPPTQPCHPQKYEMLHQVAASYFEAPLKGEKKTLLLLLLPLPLPLPLLLLLLLLLLPTPKKQQKEDDYRKAMERGKKTNELFQTVEKIGRSEEEADEKRWAVIWFSK